MNAESSDKNNFSEILNNNNNLMKYPLFRKLCFQIMLILDEGRRKERYKDE